MSKPSVAILMSTYNGEAYLVEQINSILNQTYQNIQLFIRDDGSSDGTLGVLQSFSNNPRITIVQGRKNLGYKNSFLILLKKIVESKKEFGYFSFSDQDDVWQEGKISSAISLLEKNTQNKLRLYYTGLTFVDNELNFLKVKDETQGVITFGSEIVRHSISGATMVFSYDLGEISVMYEDVFKILGGHDSFIFRLNAAMGGLFIKDEQNYIQFRRHNTNTSSATSGIFSKIKNELTRSNKSETDTAYFIRQHFGDVISPEISREISILLDYKKNFINKIKLIRNRNFRRDNVLMNMLFIYRVLLSKL